jgi:hypothetical protein
MRRKNLCAALEAVSGREVTKVETFEDQNMARCFAIRAHYGKEHADYYITNYRNELSVEVIEEALEPRNYTAWPPPPGEMSPL